MLENSVIALRILLYLLAFVFFLLAGFPNVTSPSTTRFEWLAAACLTASLLIK